MAINTMENKGIFNTIKKVFVHLQVWTILFIISYFLFRGNHFQMPLYIKFLIWGIYLIVFYSNFLFLFKKYLFAKNYKMYVLTSILVICIASVSISLLNWSNMRFDRRIVKYGLLPNLEKADSVHFPTEIKEQLWRLGSPSGYHLKSFRQMPPGISPKRLLIRIFLPSFFSVMFIYAISISLKFYQQWQEDEKRNEEIEKGKVEAELLFLKQQINPHFLFNSLNNIYSLSIAKSDYTTDAILKLSSILRYMLYRSKENRVSLAEELIIVDDYIELQRLRLTDKVKLSYEAHGEFEKYKIEPFILIPLVENCFKFGVNNAQGSYIDIYIGVQDYTLTYKSVNTIVVDKVTTIKESSGIGMENIVRRLELLYPDNYSFETSKAEGLFNVELIIKLRG